MSYLNAAVDAVREERRFYSDLAQYIVWWMLNGRRTKGIDIIPVQDWTPSEFMHYLRNPQPKDTSHEQSSEDRKKIIAKMDAMHAKEIENKNKP